MVNMGNAEFTKRRTRSDSDVTTRSLRPCYANGPALASLLLRPGEADATESHTPAKCTSTSLINQTVARKVVLAVSRHQIF
jgi:hypothetical protein